MPDRSLSCIGRLAAVAAGLLLGFAAHGRALAEVRVEGSGDALRVEADGSSLATVLDALGVTFDPRYRTSGDLSGPVSRDVSGSLTHILSILLAGFDYAAVISETGAYDIRWIMPKTGGGAGAFVPPPLARTARDDLTPPSAPPTTPQPSPVLKSPGPGDSSGPQLMPMTKDMEIRLRAAGRWNGQ